MIAHRLFEVSAGLRTPESCMSARPDHATLLSMSMILRKCCLTFASHLSWLPYANARFCLSHVLFEVPSGPLIYLDYWYCSCCPFRRFPRVIFASALKYNAVPLRVLLL